MTVRQLPPPLNPRAELHLLVFHLLQQNFLTGALPGEDSLQRQQFFNLLQLVAIKPVLVALPVGQIVFAVIRIGDAGVVFR